MPWAAPLGICHGEKTLNSVFATIYCQCKRNHIIFLISFPSTPLTMSLHLISLIWILECCINIFLYVEKRVWIMPCWKSKKTAISNILSKSTPLPCKWVHEGTECILSFLPVRNLYTWRYICAFWTEYYWIWEMGKWHKMEWRKRVPTRQQCHVSSCWIKSTLQWHLPL